MSGPSRPGWISTGVLIATFLAVICVSGVQTCQQNDPSSCPQDQWCDTTSNCVKLQDSGTDTTTYIILGCVIGGIIIIVIVIVILYCCRWEWLQRLRYRTGPQMAPTRPQIGFQQQPRQRNWRSISKKLKLKFGAPKKNPYISNTNVGGMSSNIIGSSGFVVPNRKSTVDTSNYMGFETSSTSPYVATVALTDNNLGFGTPSNYNTASAGQTVIQVDSGNNMMGPYMYNSLQDLNLIGNQMGQQPAFIQTTTTPQIQDLNLIGNQIGQQPAFIQTTTTPQINIQAQIPTQQQQLQTIIAQPSQPMMQSTVTSQAIPHIHQVIPGLYPNLNSSNIGHSHSHGPTTYQTEIPMKF